MTEHLFFFNALRTWLARLLIGLVLLFNLQCAILFLWQPETYAPSFELSDIPGTGMVRGVGLLFLMWNVPYAVALLDPQRHRTSLYEAVAMQAIALVGETFIFMTLPTAHFLAHNTLIRFIAFDGVGLAALLLAAWITRNLAAPSSGK